MFNFPSSPSLGETYPAVPTPGVPNYFWDGEKWKTYNTRNVSPAATAPPLMDALAAPGTAAEWSRGDHRHPSDTSRVPSLNATFTGTLTASSFNASGNVALSGVISTTADGNQFGNAGPETYDATSPANANIVFFDYGSNNWAGMGADVNGFFYLRMGGGGSNNVAALIADITKVGFTGPVYAPTPANGDNSTKGATTAYVVANQPMGGPYLPLAGGTVTGPTFVSGDLYLYGYTGSNNASVLYFGAPSQDRYFHYSTNGNYYFGNAPLYTANGRCWGDGDWTRPVTSARIGPHAGDFTINSAALQEPYGGAVLTGHCGPLGGVLFRFRYDQIYVEGTWYTAGNV